ncbi:MAG: GlsB/YeaQ/YmgE family stress response membrane protein [Phycisphaerae bacterium]
MSFIGFLLIGLCAGWLASQFVKGSGSGLVANMIIGVIGAMVGGFLFDAVGLSASGTIGNLICATVGAVVLLVLLRAIRKA